MAIWQEIRGTQGRNDLAGIRYRHVTMLGERSGVYNACIELCFGPPGVGKENSLLPLGFLSLRKGVRILLCRREGRPVPRGAVRDPPPPRPDYEVMVI